MTTPKYILAIIIGLLVASCKNNVEKSAYNLQDSSESKVISLDRFYTEDSDRNGEFMRVYYVQVNVDTLYNELNKSGSEEVYFQSDTGSILFLRMGKILSEDKVNAIILSSPTDTSYRLELFTKNNSEWERNDEIIVESYPLQFDLDFIDFDFDGLKDIYIQCSASNGYSISRGHLLTIDKATNRFILHKELRELGNLNVDTISKSVLSEEVIWCRTDGHQEICKLTHNWINGKLKQRKRDCPCEEK